MHEARLSTMVEVLSRYQPRPKELHINQLTGNRTHNNSFRPQNTEDLNVSGAVPYENDAGISKKVP